MESPSPSVSLNASALDGLLKEPASASVPYLLTLVQPLTAPEIRAHEFRRQYAALWGREDVHDLAALLATGTEAGLLIPLEGEGGTYYFLNSAVAVGLPPLTAEAEEVGTAVLAAGGQRDGPISLPPGAPLGQGHPVPRLPDPSTFFAWYTCLGRPIWRKALRLLQEGGPLPRRELGRRGAPLPVEEVQGALRCGVLRAEGEQLDFPLARTALPPTGEPWTARPPVAWFSRSFEPLACVEGATEAVAKAESRSPVELLRTLAAAGGRVRPHRRRPHLTLNLLYRPAAVLPPIEALGPGSLPSRWENRKGAVYPVQEGYERASAALRLQQELAGTERSWRDDALDELATKRIHRYLRAREATLANREGDGQASGYGLGSGAIASLAQEELERDKLAEERRLFERFLEVLRNGGQTE